MHAESGEKTLVKFLSKNLVGPVESRVACLFKRNVLGSTSISLIVDGDSLPPLDVLKSFCGYFKASAKSSPYACFFDEHCDSEFSRVGPRFNAEVLWTHFWNFYGITEHKLHDQEVCLRDISQGFYSQIADSSGEVCSASLSWTAGKEAEFNGRDERDFSTQVTVGIKLLNGSSRKRALDSKESGEDEGLPPSKHKAKVLPRHNNSKPAVAGIVDVDTSYEGVAAPEIVRVVIDGRELYWPANGFYGAFLFDETRTLFCDHATLSRELMVGASLKSDVIKFLVRVLYFIPSVMKTVIETYFDAFAALRRLR